MITSYEGIPFSESVDEQATHVIVKINVYKRFPPKILLLPEAQDLMVMLTSIDHEQITPDKRAGYGDQLLDRWLFLSNSRI